MYVLTKEEFTKMFLINQERKMLEKIEEEESKKEDCFADSFIEDDNFLKNYK